MKYLRYEILERVRVRMRVYSKSYAFLASRSIVWSLAMTRSIRDYVPVKTDLVGCSLDRTRWSSSQVYMYILLKKFQYFRRRSCPTKIFQHKNFYYESLIIRKFPDLRQDHSKYVMHLSMQSPTPPLPGKGGDLSQRGRKRRTPGAEMFG